MSGSSFSLSGLVNSIFGSNKKSQKNRYRRSRYSRSSSGKHVCSSKCGYCKKRGHVCSSKCGRNCNKKRFSMKYKMRGG